MESSDSDDTVVMTSPKGETYHEQDVQHLFRAIRKGKGHLTRFMLAASNNALLNCWDKEGKTPLIECCYIKEEGTRDHMVRILKDAGADVNMKDRNGRTALIHACEQRCNDIVRILVQHCNINPDIDDTDGNSALIHSANIGNDVALELLVRNFRRLGLQVDHYNKAGYTALHVAARNGYLQCAKILALKGKASLTVKDKVHQLTPLEWCLKQGYQKPEVEFLKPSAKFYRLAKLTTTMAKYRKKSTQESLLSLQGSPKTSPPRQTEKSKSKMKGLLKKTKTQSADESSEQVARSKGSDSSILDKISSSIKTESQSSHKKIGVKGNKQRSFSASDQTDEAVLLDQASKAALSHSYSHPMGQTSKGENTHGRLQGHVSLSDEFGECDTDEQVFSDTESSLVKFGLSSDLDTSRDSSSLYAEGGVYCGSTPSGSDDTPRYSDSSSPYYADGGVYCGYTPSSCEASHSLDPRKQVFRNGTPYCGASTPSYSESTPSPAPSGIDVNEECASGDEECDSENDDEESDTSSDEVTRTTNLNTRGEFDYAARKEAKPKAATKLTSGKTHTVPSMTTPTFPSKITPTAQSMTTPTSQSTTTPSSVVKQSSNKPSHVDRGDSASPPTETECLDSITPWETIQESSEPECVSSTPIPDVKLSDHALVCGNKLSNKIKGKSPLATKSPVEEREAVSPLTEIEYLDMADGVYTKAEKHVNDSMTLAVDVKGNKNIPAVVSLVQSSSIKKNDLRDTACHSPITEIEYLDDSPEPVAPSEGPRRPEPTAGQNKVNKTPGSVAQPTKIQPQGRVSTSPKTEVEYVDLTTPDGSRTATPMESVVPASTESRAYQSSVRKFTDGLNDQDIPFVDQASRHGSCQLVPSGNKSRGLNSDTEGVSRDIKGVLQRGRDHINDGNPGRYDVNSKTDLSHFANNNQGHDDLDDSKAANVGQFVSSSELYKTNALIQ